MPSERAPSGFAPALKLHRLSWIFVSVQYLRQFVAPLAVALFVGARSTESLVGLALIIPLLAAAFWHQRVYRYGFGPQGLVIREGLFFRTVRTIDYRRIENVDTERNLLHRLLGVAEVRVETSSGGSSEARVRVLDLAAVDDMRRRLFEARDNVVEQAKPVARPAEDELLHLGAGELVRFGIIDNRGLIVVAAVFGLLMQGGEQMLMKQWLDTAGNILPLDGFSTLGPMLQAFFVMASIIGLIAGTRVLSILLALVTLHDFRLVQRGNDLHVQHGLFTRLSLTMRKPRIQAAHMQASLLHRLFKRVSVRVDLAGGLGGGNEQQQSGDSVRKLWLAPVCTPEKGAALVRVALPQVTLDSLDWQRLSPRARWRLFRLSCGLWILLAGILLGWFFHWWAVPLILAGLPLLWLNAQLYVKYTGWALHDDFLAIRRGWLTRRLSVTPRNRVQSVKVTASPFDRRYGMASLSVDTAGASGQRMRIRYLDRDIAVSIAGALHLSHATHRENVPFKDARVVDSD